jgi:hypothetical protein
MPTVPATPPAFDDILLTVDELSERWRLSVQSLANLRSKGEGVPYVKLPSGSIRYKLSDVLEAEGDGQYGFSWEGLKDALKSYEGLTANQRNELMMHLKRNMK